MPIFFANLWQTQNISIMCGTSNSSVDPRITYVKMVIMVKGCLLQILVSQAKLV